MFSQSDEERVILDYFGAYRGTFLDLGCNDGKTLSNTYALSLLGWSGVLVDASPRAFERIEKRDGLYAFNLALGKEDGTIVLSESGSHLSDDDIALVSTINPSEKTRFERTTEFTNVEVGCMKWESFINYCPIKTFDFISMDIEGSEMDVLPFMDLSKTQLICIEWNSKQTLKNEYERYLSGFKLIHTTPENLIYGR